MIITNLKLSTKMSKILTKRGEVVKTCAIKLQIRRVTKKNHRQRIQSK